MSMNDGVFVYRAANDLELRGPVNTQEPTPVAMQTIAGGTTVTGRLFNEGNDRNLLDLETKLTSDILSGVVAIPIDEIVGFNTGDTVELSQDDGSIHRSTLTVNAAAGIATLVDITTFAASQGALFRRVIMAITGVHYAVSDFGTWKIGDKLVVNLDDTTDQTTTVDGLVTLGSQRLLRVEDVPTSAVSSCQPIKNQLGIDLTAWVDYGTAASPPIVGDKGNGFRVPIPETHVGIFPGIRIRGEILADDGLGLVVRDSVSALVQGP